VKYSEGSRLRCIEIFIKYAAEITEEAVELLLDQNPIISVFTIHSAPFNKTNTTKSNVAIQYTTQVVDNNTHCGVINASYFSGSLDTFTEAQQLMQKKSI
jgi:hypothetical protein